LEEIHISSLPLNLLLAAASIASLVIHKEEGNDDIRSVGRLGKSVKCILEDANHNNDIPVEAQTFDLISPDRKMKRRETWREGARKFSARSNLRTEMAFQLHSRIIRPSAL